VGDSAQEVGLKQRDGGFAGVFAGDLQRGGGDVRSGNGVAAFESKGDGNGPGAGADVDDSASGGQALQDGFDEKLSFRTGNQDGRCNPEIAAVEFLASGDVLGRLAADAFVQVAPVVNPLDFPEFLLGVRVEVFALAVEGVSEEDFRIQAGLGDSGGGKEIGTLLNGRPNVEKAARQSTAPSRCSFSAW
jgi:hypothetical protein